MSKFDPENEIYIFKKAMLGCNLRTLFKGGARSSALEIVNGNDELLDLLIGLAEIIERSISLGASLEAAINNVIQIGLLDTIKAQEG